MAGRPGAVIEASQIAAAARVPPAFAAKILQKLAAARIVRSQRGKTRGYSLAAPESLSVRAIVEALDGPDIFERCVFWRNRCNNARPCPLHDLWKRVRPEVAAQMERMTIAQMTAASARSSRARVAPRLPR